MVTGTGASKGKNGGGIIDSSFLSLNDKRSGMTVCRL